MTLTYDPIPELRKFGYTAREASFVYLVAMHSGYFLRRQFLAFLKRQDGAMVQNFLRKSAALDHVRPIEYAQGRHIYHLCSRSVYRTLGEEDSQARRVKADREIKSRLMQLDYVLDHLEDRFLETAETKLEFFRARLGIASASLPYGVPPNGRTSTSVRSFPSRFPIGVERKGDGFPSVVSFAYIDDGLRTVSNFVLWLTQHQALLTCLPSAEVVYVADAVRNFPAAEHEFLRRFPSQNARQISVRGYLLQHDYPIWSMRYRRTVL
jgi:hypothetical protein